MGNSNENAKSFEEQAPIPRSVVINLVVFSLLMGIAPLATYYLLYYILSYSSTVSGISAAISANIVLFCYIIIAYMEDDQENSKKNE